MPEYDRQQFTLLSAADAEALRNREGRQASVSSARAPSYAMRPSQTVFGRESNGDDASEVASSVLDGSINSSIAPTARTRLSVSPDGTAPTEDRFETDWEGYVWKQGHVVRSWRYRYAILSGTFFSYYVSKEVAMVDTEKYRGRVTVTGARRDGQRPSGVLLTTTIDKVFSVQARTPMEAEIWVRMVQMAVQAAGGRKVPESMGATGATNVLSGSDNATRDSDQSLPSQMNAMALCGTGSLVSTPVRSSGDWKTRNLNTVKNFYSIWASQFLERRGPDEIAANFMTLFPLCSPDMVLTVRYPCEFLPSSVFHGREGMVDVVLSLLRFVRFRKFQVSRYLSTKHPNVLQVLATGKLWNNALQEEFVFNTRDELTLSPGGRVLSMQMQIDVDFAAFQLSESEKKAIKNDRAFQASTSKRVLSLSIQHFHVTRVLGKGTFGTVVLAERRNTAEVFALKILEKGSMSNYDKLRTKTEMKILRDLHHPFIAPLKFAFQSPSRVFLGMEYYPGGSLYTHMNKFSNDKEHRVKIALDIERVRFYTAQIVLALCHLHACDIVYRDLKPDNIMIDYEGNIALVDFGLSKTSVGQMTGARTMAGSPAYTAPELLKPKRSRDYGKAVDWWCLGILIYEMLLAKRPFHHLNVSVLYKLIEKDPVKFPSKCGIPSEARHLILGLLEKDPNKRLGAKHASDLLTHPFFKDVKWDQVLKKKLTPPWTPQVVSIEEERMKAPEVNYDKYLASNTYSAGSFFTMLFPWKNPYNARGRRKMERDADGFDKFSYVSDTTNSFLVDEDEMLDSAFTGRRSIQMQTLTGEAT